MCKRPGRRGLVSLLERRADCRLRVLKKGDLSKFVEGAVLDCAVAPAACR